MTKKSVYIGVFILFITAIVSCEKDFQDIATNVVSNTKFETKDTIIEVLITNKQITNVRADGLTISGSLGQYLLGVYNNPNYEKIEASMISQLALDTGANSEERAYGADTTIVATIDTVFLKLPYQATLKEGTQTEYTLDSIIGDPTKAFTLNVYRTDTYMNRLNPIDPSKANSYQSDASYQILPGELNAEVDYQFKPSALDTIMLIKKRLSTGEIYKTDTLRLTSNNPFARIPLDEAKMKQIFLDQFGTSNFESQEAINEYFKGLYIEASGNEGSLLGLNISTINFSVKPSIEIHYTKTVLKGGTTVVDTLERSNSFLLSNFSTSIYKMDEKVYPNDKNIVLQGTAGNMAQIEMLKGSQLLDLREKNLLINDAKLTFYVNQDIVGNDTIATPFKLFLYKDGSPASQIKDKINESGGLTQFGGNLVVTDGRPDYYSFRLTDYISDLLNGETDYNPTLGLKVFNTSDDISAANDTLISTHNWNPKAVTLLNHFPSNGTRRAQLKITYTRKK